MESTDSNRARGLTGRAAASNPMAYMQGSRRGGGGGGGGGGKQEGRGK